MEIPRWLYLLFALGAVVMMTLHGLEFQAAKETIHLTCIIIWAAAACVWFNFWVNP